MSTRSQIHQYWQNPDSTNAPWTYTDPIANARSEYLVQLVKNCVPKEAKILEIGCNAGRNLHFLNKAGYKNLSGIEINYEAIKLCRTVYPETFSVANFYPGAVEDVLKTCESKLFDLTFTMACLEHIHTDSNWIFEHIARVTKNRVIAIEDELNSTPRHFPRCYSKIFSNLGHTTSATPTPGNLDLGPGFVTTIVKIN